MISLNESVGSIAVTNIGELVTNDAMVGAGKLGVRKNAALVIEEGRVAWVGDSAALPSGTVGQVIDVGGRSVVPGFVDSHTHLVFDGNRAEEFAARMAGVPYSAGGIRTTVAATRNASDERLRSNVHSLLREAHLSGSTTIEIKSGYGLTVKDEERSLSIAHDVSEETTFLGAHVVPQEFENNRDSYVDLVCGEMLERCHSHAKWIDIFCDHGAFDGDEAKRILNAGIKKGLLPRVHANQLGPGDGVQIAVALDAASADHCTHLKEKDIEALGGSRTVATLLPIAEFSTRSAYPDARRLLDAGADVAIASDCNPGSSYSTSMPLAIALAVREMKMTVEEALYAATVGGAHALRRCEIGHLGVGAQGDFVVLNAPSYLFLAYRPGVDQISSVYRGGVRCSSETTFV